METLERGTLFNSAAIAGAALGLISGSYVFLTTALSGNVAGSIVSSALWFAKLVGCIWLMRWGMILLTRKYEGVSNTDTRSFGLLAAAFSSLITAACTYIAYEFVFPDFVAQQLDSVYQMYGQFLDSNSMSALDKVTENYPVYNFFSQLLWCFIYGALLTSILSSRIPVPTPEKFFDDVRKMMEEEENRKESDNVDEQ